MKLIRCYISSFGKIKDFKYDFTDGINTIKQDNGWGKSTLASFIKCMFYGLSHKTKGLTDNDRLRYKPWNSTEKFGGNLVFEKNGKQYELQRFFGNKESEDTASLTDLETGKVYEANDIGKRVFSIDQDGFMSTTFFGQRDFEIKSNSSLTSKFNEIYEMADENTFEKAVGLLTDKSKEYVKTGNKGLIAQTKTEIYQIDEEIESLNQSSKTLKTLRENNDNVAIEINGLKKKKEAIDKKIESLLKNESIRLQKESYDKKINEREILLKRIKNSQNVLLNNVEKAKEIDKIEGKVNEYNKLSGEKKSFESIVEILKNTQPKNNGVNKCVLLFIVPILLLALSVGLVFFNPIIALISFILTVVSFVGVLFIYIKSKNSRISLNNGNDIQIKIAELNEINTKCFTLEETIKNYFSLFSVDDSLSYFDKCKVIGNALKEYEESYSSYAVIQDEIERLSKDSEVMNYVRPTEDLDELKSVSQNYHNEIEEKNKQITENKGKIARLENDVDTLFEKENKKAELAENLKKYQKDYEIVVKTIELFNKTNDNMKTKYRLPLESSLNKYLSLIDDGNIQAKIDIDFNVTVAERQGEMVADYYSKGYQNLFEICKRFALIDVLFKGDKPFIVLDDPFCNLDDKKIEKAIDLLNKLKNEYQIVYLVCHESRRA